MNSPPLVFIVAKAWYFIVASCNCAACSHQFNLVKHTNYLQDLLLLLIQLYYIILFFNPHNMFGCSLTHSHLLLALLDSSPVAESEVPCSRAQQETLNEEWGAD